MVSGYLRWDADSVSGDGGPPDHQVGERCYPQYTSQERDGEKFASWKAIVLSEISYLIFIVLRYF